ncbi:galactosyltransferase-related protein [Amycolatopsis sp. CA-128772]|uniref:galactosyltransferase-related protein n=1 Tax=Amycolatopsis sp. CA-128772 TaxID=2073159 RepID=UPI0011B03D6E|nr:galactosyltransferase-related protein [Amycolatopsis sp. CA-128772]
MTGRTAPRPTGTTAVSELAEALVLLAHPGRRLNDHSWPAERALLERAVDARLAPLSPGERTEVAAAATAAAGEEGDRVALDRLELLLADVGTPPGSTAAFRELDRLVFRTRLSPGHGTATGAFVADPAPSPATGRGALTVIVPFRASTEDRTRNLAVTLRAVRDAARDVPDVEVTLVEQDSGTRLNGVPRTLYDSHVLVADSGPFNKSWSVNAGVRRSAHERICVLDADLLVDRAVLAAMLRGLDDADLFVPYRRVTWMDEVSTTRTIAAVTAASGPYRLDGAAARGLSIDGLYGGCFAVRRDFYLAIGGHDERYTGWGGEDNAFHELAAAHGRTGRGDFVMAHQNHVRPPATRDDGTMFNEHLQGTRPGGGEIGRLRPRPRAVRR